MKKNYTISLKNTSLNKISPLLSKNAVSTSNFTPKQKPFSFNKCKEGLVLMRHTLNKSFIESIKALEGLSFNKRTTPLDLDILAVVIKYKDSDNKTCLSRAFIAGAVGCHVDTVTTGLSRLVRAGLIAKERFDYIRKDGKMMTAYLVLHVDHLIKVIALAKKECGSKVSLLTNEIYQSGRHSLSAFLKRIKPLRIKKPYKKPPFSPYTENDRLQEIVNSFESLLEKIFPSRPG